MLLPLVDPCIAEIAELAETFFFFCFWKVTRPESAYVLGEMRVREGLVMVL